MKTRSSRKARSAPHAVNITGSASEGVKWQFTVQARSAARRFEQVMRACVFSAPAAPHAQETLGTLAARLICLDGIRPDALPLLNSCASKPYRCTDRIAIEWEDRTQNRIERRFIHPLTLSVWPHSPALVLVDQDDNSDQGSPSSAGVEGAVPTHNGPFVHCAIGDLTDPLQGWLKAHGFYVSDRDPIRALGSDQLAWWSEHLPGPLFAHGAGKFVLTPLDRAAWARRETGQALVPEQTAEANDAPDEFQTDKLLDHLDAAMGAGFDENLLKLALEVLKTSHSSGVDGLTKRLWVEGLLNLNLSLSTNNPCTVVLVGWICHMCEFGTVSSHNPAASTISHYANAALMPLGNGLKNITSDPADWDPLQLGMLYSTICAAKSTGMRAATSAALMSFQGYLEEVFDTEHLASAFDRSASSDASSSTTSEASMGTRVKANVLWPHEIAWCLDACLMAPDSRVGQIARVMLAIASECAVRHQDLSRLVMANVSFGTDELGDYCQIEVVRRAARGRLKTITSQRHLLVRNSSSIQIIRTWHGLRGKETGSLSAYFLGDKNSDKTRYRPSATQALLNQLVKRASGCPTMRFHDLRHTVISHQVQGVLCSFEPTDINPLQVVATAAGHAIPLTTLRSYSHLYEESLRLCIDRALQKALQATADQQAQVLSVLTGRAPFLNGNSLVQGARRHDCAVTDHWLKLMNKHGATMLLQLASAPFHWAAPAPLKSRNTPQKTVSAAVLADAIGRLQRGETLSSVARMAGIPQPLFEDLLQRLDVWLAGVYRHHFPRKTHDLRTMPELAERLATMRVDAGDCATEFWAAFSLALDKVVSRDIMRTAVDCWEVNGRGLHMPLTPRAIGRPLLQLLSHALLDRGNIRAVVQSPKATSTSRLECATNSPLRSSLNPVVGDPATIDAVTDLFLQELKSNPWMETSLWRPERPMAYLRINPHVDADRTAPTAEKTGAFRGWLVAIKARLLLDELEGGVHA